ncbi:hypothetical protein ID866_9755 [Astraeus odoratus]|nr:hypothetical protein ID866_9755 [Astraeus odoratus]
MEGGLCQDHKIQMIFGKHIVVVR